MSVANLSPQTFGEFTMLKFHDTRTNVVRVSYGRRTTVLRKHANTLQLSEKIKLNDIRTNLVRHSHECLATVVRMKMKLKQHSWERCETLSRMFLQLSYEFVA